MKMSKFFGSFTVIAICFLFITMIKGKNKPKELIAPNAKSFGDKVNSFLGAKKLKQDRSQDDEFMEAKDQKYRVFDPVIESGDEGINCKHNDQTINLRDLKQKYIDFQEACSLENCNREKQRAKKFLMFDVQHCEKAQ